jgi:uncharacterized protein
MTKFGKVQMAALLATGCLRAQANVDLPATVLTTLARKYTAPETETRYFDASVDLNGDGRPEFVVYIVGPMVCGSGGCPLVVFTPSRTGYRQVAAISVSQPPIRVSKRSSHRWRNLIVGVSGGGAKAGHVELAYNGKKYPSNPTVPPAKRINGAVSGTVLIPKFDSFAAGKLLVDTHPSFKCAQAAAPVENLICSDTALSELDRKLAAVYARAMKEWTGDLAAGEQAKERDWVAARNRCSAAPDPRTCVEAAYRRRIVEVQIQSGQLMAPTPVSYVCDGRPDTPFTVSFYSQTDPPSAVLTFGDQQAIALAEPSASGSQYSAPDVQFREHQGAVTVDWSGRTLSCQTH